MIVILRFCSECVFFLWCRQLSPENSVTSQRSRCGRQLDAAKRSPDRLPDLLRGPHSQRLRSGPPGSRRTTMKAKIAACLFLACLSISGRAQNWIKAPIVYENMPGEIRLAGDVDGDGDVDYIRFDGSRLEFRRPLQSLRWPVRDGHERRAPAAVRYPGPLRGSERRRVARRDRLDAHGSSPGIGLSVFPGQPGGTFAAPVHVSLPGIVVKMRPGHGNADGFLDLAVVNHEPASNAGRCAGSSEARATRSR